MSDWVFSAGTGAFDLALLKDLACQEFIILRLHRLLMFTDNIEAASAFAFVV